MNTTDQVPSDLVPNLDDPLEESAPLTGMKISGFDQGTRPLFSQPTLYLSIGVVFIVALVSLGNNPILFWTSFLAMSALALILHVLAERIIFRSKTEFSEFTAPLDGVFVVTFGSLLPGLGLLAYGVYSFSSSLHQSFFEDIGKLALLLVVPVFNYAVWSGIRKGYLIRPRLVGLMSGLALGLSISWAAIFVKLLLAPTNGSCKFGWMLLMCMSPFLLLAALSLSVDLWHKTEPGMRRITTAFSVMGISLSCLFVFAPMVRTFSIQSMINDARQNSSEAQTKAITVLRSIATAQDLSPSKYPVSGFNLAELLISERGLDSGTALDRDLYFKITGKPYSDVKVIDSNQPQSEQSAFNPLVGSKITGLSLVKSQFSGDIDSQSLSSSIDWTLIFCNMSSASQEARAEISLPRGSVVSRVTLWINGEPRDATFVPIATAQAAYNSGVSRAPLLVTMPATDRILLQCFPVPADHRAVKARLEFNVPLETAEGKTCSLELPSFVDSNFSVPKRQKVSITSRDRLVKSLSGMEQHQNARGYLLDGIIKTDNPRAVTSLLVSRSTPLSEFATPDSCSHDQRFIVQRLQEEEATRSPKRLFVVIDPSTSMKTSRSEIRDALSSLEVGFQPSVIFAATPESDKVQKEVPAESIEQALAQLNAETFEGGQDNGPALRQALETAAERPNSAVIWIHGPQPLAQPAASETTPLDLVHNVCIYDLQTESGSAPILEALHMEDPSNQIHYVTLHHESISKDVKALLAGWKNGTTQFVIKRTLITTRPEMTILADPSVSAQVTELWAKEEFERLEATGQGLRARKLASSYRLVTPITGAVVSEKSKVDESRPLRSAELRTEQTVVSSAPSSGLVGAPIDPRYGQSNQVGMMADFGYDTARDICRILTAISMLLSIIIAVTFIRSRTRITSPAVAKAVALVIVVPLIVHLIGSFMINNFGGLGGGL